MKIVQINCVNVIGSTGRIVAQISDCLNSHDVENYVAHGIPAQNRTNSYLVNNPIDAHLHSFISRKLCMQGRGSVLPTKRLVNYLKKLKPDIVHLHNLHGHYLNYKILFQYLANSDIHVVWTLHDCWAMTGKCAHFTNVGCYKWESEEGCSNCPQLATYPDSTYDRTAKNYAEKKSAFLSVENMTIVTVSEWLKGICSRSYLRDKKIICIPNGVDTNVFKPTVGDIRNKYDIPSKKIVLGVASVWNSQKGEDSFVRLADMLDDDYIIVLVGKGSDKVAKLNNNIIAIPRTDNQEELAMFYTESTVFLCMSTEESAPLVVSEAMACGTPVICYDATAMPELVHEGFGFVIQPGDVFRVKECIEKIGNSDKALFINCREHILEYHSVQSMTESYYKLYQEIYGGNI